jgi:hypothetical protein
MDNVQNYYSYAYWSYLLDSQFRLRVTSFQNRLTIQQIGNAVKYRYHPYIFVLLKVGCLHPVACTWLGSGFPSNATLV